MHIVIIACIEVGFAFSLVFFSRISYFHRKILEQKILRMRRLRSPFFQLKVFIEKLNYILLTVEDRKRVILFI